MLFSEWAEVQMCLLNKEKEIHQTLEKINFEYIVHVVIGSKYQLL